jgi:GMP synthase-like glutamine amidotransferase
MATITPLRIAMLNADIPVANVTSKYGSYGGVFQSLLTAAADRLNSSTPTQKPIVVTAEDFDVVNGQYPESIAEFDVILITGSASSSYDDVEWVHRLDRFVLDVYETHPSIKLFGSCFGHQIICQSLLREHGAIVEKQPSGWELGVHEITLTDEFQKAFAPQAAITLVPHLPGQIPRPPTPNEDGSEDTQPRAPKPSSASSSLRLQFIHADHVKLPSSPASAGEGSSPLPLPPSWVLMGSTDKCAVQGVYEPGRVLTFQGHFEFDRFVNTETVKVFGAKWDPSFLQESLDAMDKDDDSTAASDMVLKFMLEGRRTVELGLGGLPTPTLELKGNLH